MLTRTNAVKKYLLLYLNYHQILLFQGFGTIVFVKKYLDTLKTVTILPSNKHGFKTIYLQVLICYLIWLIEPRSYTPLNKDQCFASSIIKRFGRCPIIGLIQKQIMYFPSIFFVGN